MRIYADAYIDHLRRHAIPVTGSIRDYDRLIGRIGDARFVLIGEASHGTHEFYEQRAEITKRLIREKGFTAVAVEADWPEAYRINRFVQGESEDQNAKEALMNFQSFPAWMWRNTVILDFVGWLRNHNDGFASHTSKAGFYGLDLYNRYSSIEAVLGYLDRVDPNEARHARYRYAGDEHCGGVHQYEYTVEHEFAPSREDEVVAQLVDLRRKASEYARRDGPLDEFFFAEQTAGLIANAEQYYRTMFRGSVSSWNFRDRHMSDTLEALYQYLSRYNGETRIVVWAHNSHLGDARATELGDAGELNLGQLTRERHPRNSVLVGFSSYTGTVTAASEWDGAAERNVVRPALVGSYESLFHAMNTKACLVLLNEDGRPCLDLPPWALERAIGVVYHPETEQRSHYFQARLLEQFDALIYFDTTRAVEPLERTGKWGTSPSGT
jgi:erythromycin esterase-like protein